MLFDRFLYNYAQMHNKFLRCKKDYLFKAKQLQFTPITLELIEKKPCFKDSKNLDYMFLCSCFNHKRLIIITDISEEDVHKQLNIKLKLKV